MAASGELKSIKDRQGNTLSFEPNGIISSTGKSVTFVRDAAGADHARSTTRRSSATDQRRRRNTVRRRRRSDRRSSCRRTEYVADDLAPHLRPAPAAHDRRPDAATRRGRRRTTPTAGSRPTRTRSTTYQLRLQPRDADRPRRRSRTTGVVTQTFDARGLLLSETNQLGHTTTHEYDANRNETKRTNARRRGDDRDLRRPRQPDVGDRRPTGTTAHDLRRLQPADRVRRTASGTTRRSTTTIAMCRSASPTSSERGSRSRTRSRACR